MEVHDNTFRHLQMFPLVHAANINHQTTINTPKSVDNETGEPPGQWFDNILVSYGMWSTKHMLHACSTIHHGFVNNYLSQLMLIIWKSDYAQLTEC